MADIDPEHAVRCPYMSQHVMHIDSLLTHLNRCKATNKHLFKNCIYNSLHVIRKQDYKHHIQNCQDRFSKGEVEDDEWDARHRVKIQKKDESRDDSNFSSSHDDKESIVYHSNNDTNFSFQNTQEGSFYEKNAPTDQRVYPRSFFYGDQPKETSSKQQFVQRNITLDFSSKKGSNQNHQKIRRDIALSEKNTCQSSSYENSRSLIQREADDDEVLDLIKEIGSKQKVKKHEKTRDVMDSFGDDLIEVCMRKTQRKNNQFMIPKYTI